MNDEKAGTDVATRDEFGRFVKGVSGNPKGKPRGTKHQITQLREATEHALRDYLADSKNQRKAMQAIDRCMNIALAGEDREALSAMKLLFDKIIPNARGGGEEDTQKQTPVAVQIINSTGTEKPVVVIDGEVVEDDADGPV